MEETPASGNPSAPQSEQAQANSQQEPVNFNPGYGRRVTIGGGMHGTNNPMAAAAAAAADRRGSLASVGMDDLFGRRPSMGSVGFDTMNMDNLFARRDSMDSTTAAIDAAILDLTRRRSSLFLGPGGTSTANDMGVPPPPPPPPPGHHHDGSMANAPFSPTPGGGLGGYGRNPSLGAFGIPTMPQALPSQQQNAVSTIAARQKQLQEQQKELEQYQKVLELQRQKLLSNMQDRTYDMSATMPAGMPGMHPPPSMMPRYSQTGDMGYGPQGHYPQGMNTSMRGPGMGAAAGLGGSMHSAHSHASHGSMSLSQHSSHHPNLHPLPPPQHRPSNSSGSQQNWWICQVCNSKAFASQEEALAHESHCQDGSRRGVAVSGADPLQPMPMHDMSARSSFSLGMDSSQHSSFSEQPHPDTRMSSGPFAMLQSPMPLAMPSDKDWLTPLHCFVRRHCVEIFSASEQDVATPSKGKRKPIQVGQIGIRCPHCHLYDSNNNNNKSRERGSVYYPTTISSIYNATMNLLQRHLHSCPAVPQEIMRRYETLKADDARSGTSKRYWVESALSLGLVDTPNGIRHSALRPPPLPSLTLQQASTGQDAMRRNSNEFFSTKSNAVTDAKTGGPGTTPGGSNKGGSAAAANNNNSTVPKSEQDMAESAPLVTPDDKPYSTTFSYHLLSQMQPCVFTEADRLGKRKGLPPGFPGLACRHCFGGYGSGRFFPSSIKTLSDTSKTLNVLHNHMMRCRKCPSEVRDSLENLRSSHDEERAKMKFGSQKAFFARIWERLHGKGQPAAFKRPRPAPRAPPQSPQQHHHPMMHPSTPQGFHPTVADRGSFSGGMPSMPPPPPTQMGNVEAMGPPPPSPSAKRQKI